MVRKREGRGRGRPRRVGRGSARARDDEARRRERRSRPAVHRRLHRRRRRVRRARSRRPGHVLLAKRARLALLRPRRAHSHARSGRFRGGARLHARRVRAVGALRRPVLHPLDRPRLAHEDAGRGGRAYRGRGEAVRNAASKVGHDARVREAAPQGAARPHRRA